MKDFEYKDKCPQCGYIFDMATNLDRDSRGPKPGDVSICIRCGNWNIFGDDLKMRAATIDDIAGFDNTLILELGRAGKLLAEIKKRGKENQ